MRKIHLPDSWSAAPVIVDIVSLLSQFADNIDDLDAQVKDLDKRVKELEKLQTMAPIAPKPKAK